jgi:methylenetetrahydrofolate dehydrogenase (NADP+)/methenyltetrahydrofolate cyclohydrolase
VLVGADPASETYVSMKQRDCEEMGIDGVHVALDGDVAPAELYEAIEELNADPAIHGYLVQAPVPEHIAYEEVLGRIDPAKDVDGFHPENVGRLVGGNPRFKPCTPHGVQKLLAAIDVDPEGKDVTILGRSAIVGTPLANLLLQKAAGGNATVTVCHSRTKDIEEKTRQADVVVAAVGVPEFVDGSMLSPDTVVIDVGVNRIEADTEKGYELVGDVAYDSARETASAITPVPGGVGPMTRAMLLYNTVKAASQHENVAIDLP